MSNQTEFQNKKSRPKKQQQQMHETYINIYVTPPPLTVCLKKNFFLFKKKKLICIYYRQCLEQYKKMWMLTVSDNKRQNINKIQGAKQNWGHTSAVTKAANAHLTHDLKSRQPPLLQPWKPAPPQLLLPLLLVLLSSLSDCTLCSLPRLKSPFKPSQFLLLHLILSAN